jgi:hypothetical protein
VQATSHQIAADTVIYPDASLDADHSITRKRSHDSREHEGRVAEREVPGLVVASTSVATFIGMIAAAPRSTARPSHGGERTHWQISQGIKGREYAAAFRAPPH